MPRRWPKKLSRIPGQSGLEENGFLTPECDRHDPGHARDIWTPCMKFSTQSHKAQIGTCGGQERSTTSAPVTCQPEGWWWWCCCAFPARPQTLAEVTRLRQKKACLPARPPRLERPGWCPGPRCCAPSRTGTGGHWAAPRPAACRRHWRGQPARTLSGRRRRGPRRKRKRRRPRGLGSASADLKSKEEKDAELDKRIEALRRKNQALIKRYQEIEEDRRKAEQEGIAVTGARRAQPADGSHVAERRQGEMAAPTLTVQVLLSPEEKRVVTNEQKPHISHRTLRSNPSSRGSVRGGLGPGRISPRAECRPEQSGWEGAEGDGTGICKRGRGSRRPRGRGGPAGDAGPDRRSKEWEERRRQNIEKMNEEMEKIAEYERSQRDGLQERNPVRNFLDDPRRSGPFAESDRREGSRRHIRNWGGADFDKVKTGMEQGKAWPPPGRGGARHREETLDMTLSMTGRERAEYIRWKQEREQIDRERLARHRQATGEWRREWDAEKMDTMFKEGVKSGGSLGNKQDESKRPPKIPTLGAFLPERQPQRHRKGRGRGHTQGTPSKPYSMHDNRWEKEPEAAAAEAKSDAAPVQQEESPASPHAAPEEDEDQWEDVSEGEEEEEVSISQGASSVAEEEEEETSPSHSLHDHVAKPPGRDGPLSVAMPPSELETSNAEGNPLTPFSPAEGYHPVSDWGEEMELSSPRANCTKSPLAPLVDVAMAPPPGALAEETGEGPCACQPEESAAPKPGGQGAVVEPAQCLAASSSMAGIPDSQQEKAEV